MHDDPQVWAWTATLDAVVRMGGIRRATDALGISRSSVSRHLDALEAHLGVRLLDRSRQTVHPTVEAEMLLTRFRPLAREWQAALDATRAASRAPTGRIMVTAPDIVAVRYLAHVLADFGRHNPQIEVELRSTDAVVSSAEGVDVALRTQPLPDTDHWARCLLPAREVVVGHPDLIAGLDPDPAQWRVPWIVHAHRRGTNRLQHPDGTIAQVAVRNRVEVESSSMLPGLLKNGAGLAIVPDAFVLRPLCRKELAFLPWFGRQCSLFALWYAPRPSA
jgi:DNA-binding transcriptional LysR family regulator